MIYATVTVRNVLLEESLCIFWTALLPRTPSMYRRIHAASINNEGQVCDLPLGCNSEAENFRQLRVTTSGSPIINERYCGSCVTSHPPPRARIKPHARRKLARHQVGGCALVCQQRAFCNQHFKVVRRSAFVPLVRQVQRMLRGRQRRAAPSSPPRPARASPTTGLRPR